MKNKPKSPTLLFIAFLFFSGIASADRREIKAVYTTVEEFPVSYVLVGNETTGPDTVFVVSGKIIDRIDLKIVQETDARDVYQFIGFPGELDIELNYGVLSGVENEPIILHRNLDCLSLIRIEMLRPKLGIAIPGPWQPRPSQEFFPDNATRPSARGPLGYAFHPDTP